MEEPRYQITMSYTLPMLKKSIWRYWRRSLGWRYFVVMLFTVICFFSTIYKGDALWMKNAFAIILTLVILFGITTYLSNRYHVLGTYRALKDPTITFTVYDEKFSLSSELGQGEWPWSAITEVWQYKDTWLVFLARASYATFPLSAITPEAQAFIIEKLQATPCKIS